MVEREMMMAVVEWGAGFIRNYKGLNGKRMLITKGTSPGNPKRLPTGPLRSRRPTAKAPMITAIPEAAFWELKFKR